MKEYEIIIETINPCGGERHSQQEIIEAEIESPEAYVKQNGRFPVIDTAQNPDGDETTVFNVTLSALAAASASATAASVFLRM